MRINVVFVTESQPIRNLIEQKQDAVIPDSSRKLAYYTEKSARFGVFVFQPSRDMQYNRLEEFLLKIPKADGLMIVCDDYLAESISHLSVVAFIQTYSLEAEIKHPQNIIARPLARSLRDFAALGRLFDNMKQRKLIILPIRNFHAPELLQLIGLFAVDAQRERFGESLERTLAALRGRQTPKQPKTRPDVYIKDDNEKFFIYGPERHSLPDSKIPPHSHLCQLTQEMRFGRKFDRELHYNVSVQPDDTDISGTFPGCHGDPQVVRPASHINMFPNDFMTWPKR